MFGTHLEDRDPSMPLFYIAALYIILCNLFNVKRLSHGWQCDMIFIKRVVVWYHTNMSLIKSYHTVTHVIITWVAVWYDCYQTSGGVISRTSEEQASEWYHTNMSLIKSYHTVTHVIIFLSYTTTPGIIQTLSIPITPIHIIQAHTVTF